MCVCEMEYVARVGEMRNAYKVLVGNPEGKRPLGRPKHRWEYEIRMDIRETGCKGVNWIQDRDHCELLWTR